MKKGIFDKSFKIFRKNSDLIHIQYFGFHFINLFFLKIIFNKSS